MAIELIKEVLRHTRGLGLTPQEKLAAVAFAENAWIKPGHRLDRKIFTPLDDPMWQDYIEVSSAEKVKKLAQSLARKGVLESVTRGQKGQVAEYRFAHLAPSQQDGICTADDSRTAEHSSADTDPLNGFSSTDTAVQQSGNWPAYYLTPTTPLPACGPVVVEDRQAGGEPTQDTPADGAVERQPAAVLRAVEGPENPSSDGEAEMDPAAAAGRQDAAARVLAAVDFGRMLSRDEHDRLTGRLSVLVSGGWSVDALVKNLGDLGGANSRVAVFSKRAKELPDSAPSVKAPRKDPGTADVIAALDAVVAADRVEVSEEDRDLGQAFRAQLRAKRAQAAAQTAAPAAAGVIAAGAAAKRRDVPAGLSRLGVLMGETDTRTRSCTRRRCRRSRSPRS